MHCLILRFTLIVAGFLAWHSTGLADEPAPEASRVWTVLEPIKTVSAGGATFTKLPDGSYLVGGANPVTDTYTITAHTRLTGITAIRLEALSDPSLPAGGPGRAFNGNFVLAAFRVTAAPRQEPAKAILVAFRRATADYSQPGFSVAGLSEANPKSFWAVDPMFGRRHGAIFELKAPVGFAQGTVLTFTLQQAHVHPQHTLGRWRLSATTAKPPVPLELLELTAQELTKAWDDLAAVDGATAERAVATLVAIRKPVAFLKARLKPEAVNTDAERIAKLVKDLNHDKYAVRELATKELEKLGPFAAPALAQMLLDPPSPEAQLRATALLAKVKNTPSQLRAQRGVEVLVRLGTSDARQFLEQLARGPADAWLTQEAKGGMKRLDN